MYSTVSHLSPVLHCIPVDHLTPLYPRF
jgi:hypothetical protein